MECILVDDDTMMCSYKGTSYKCINKSGIVLIDPHSRIRYVDSGCIQSEELTDVIIKHYPTFIKRLIICVYIVTIYSVWIQLMM